MVLDQQSLDGEALPCLPNIDSTYDLIVNLGYRLLLHHQYDCFHQIPDHLCLQLQQWGWDNLPRQRWCPMSPLGSHGCIDWRLIIVGRKIGTGEDKNRNHIGTLLHDFHIFLHQKKPWSLWLFVQLGCLSQIGLLGWTNFDITDVTAPTPAQIFGGFGDLLSKIVKEMMGRL